MSDIPKILSVREFDLDDQNLFAAASGDYNPIHVDPLVARRTYVGQCIVHGIHTLLWALESLYQSEGVTAVEIVAKFIRPVFLNEQITCQWLPDKSRMRIFANETMLSEIIIKSGTVVACGVSASVRDKRGTVPLNPTFAECAAQAPWPFSPCGDLELLRKCFPHVIAVHGTLAVEEMAALSYVVGMEYPGLNSIFSSLSLSYDVMKTGEPMCSMVECDERFNTLEISVRGRSLNGLVNAFYRPAPCAGPVMADLLMAVDEGEFKDVKALIIGGSRGLGEVVAKLIAAGGGSFLATYNVGKTEAEQLLADIRSAPGTGQVAQVGVHPALDLPFSIGAFNQVYYFASPKISGRRNAEYDQNMGCVFEDIYVHAFRRLCELFNKQDLAPVFFYPSTTFIEENQKEFQAYIVAKLAGEALCQQMEREHGTKIVTQRLPKLDTDQTQAVIPQSFGSPVQAMLPIIRQMCAR